MSLQFGVLGFGLPSLVMPWEERRVQAEINVRLVEAPRPPAPPAPAKEPLRLALSPQLSLEPPAAAQPAKPPRADGSFEVVTAPEPKAPAPLAEPLREARKPAPAAKTRARDRKLKAKPQPPILAQADPEEETFNVPPPKRPQPEPPRAPQSAAKKQTEEPRSEVVAAETARRQAEEAARIEAEQAARRRAEEEARQLALAREKELEAKQQEEARRLEEQKEEEARLALELEAQKLAEEAAREEAEKLALRRALELKKEQEAKEEEAKRLALELEAAKRVEDAREQAIAREKELEARRLAEEAATRAKEAAERKRAEAEAAAQRERDRLAAQKGPAAGPAAPGAPSGKELAPKVLDQLRTPGAAREKILAEPGPPPRPENPRRRSLFGVERDVGLRMYVESFRWKIERNGTLNYRPSAGWSARDNPIVTVSIRSDGTLEDVAIHRSSGLREIDEAVRRIARLNAPYSRFPPALAHRYDVIDIRRVWSFDGTLRILDEM